MTEAREAEFYLEAQVQRYWRAVLCLVVLLVVIPNLAVLGWFVVREIDRTKRLETNSRILDVTAHSAVQLDCFTDVYFLNPDPALDQEGRRQAVVGCIEKKEVTLNR